jgi:hypothetical protein
MKNKRPAAPRTHPSPLAERQSGDLWRIRLGLIATVLIVLVAGFLLYTRLATLRPATPRSASSAATPAARDYDKPWLTPIRPAESLQ